MARVYVKQNTQPKQRVYVSGPNAGQQQTKRIYVSGPQAGQVAQPKIIQPPKTGFSGLAQNAKTDFGSFAKGILGLGRQAITHPLDTGGKILGIGAEILKGTPQAVMDLGHNVANFGEVQRKGIESLKQLRQIPLEQQKEELAKLIQQIGESPEAKDNPDKRRLAQMGMGLLGNYSQYSRFGEKVYKEPFSFALDVLPTAKLLGAEKLTKGAVNLATRIPTVARGVEKVSDAFTPLGKLRRLDPQLADDVAKTGTNMRRAQEGIIRATVKKFDDTFKLSKTERVEFFDSIDSLRRTGGVPTSANPKVMKAIDWYMKEELPKIQKVAGYGKKVAQPLQEGNPLIQEARLKYKKVDIEKAPTVYRGTMGTGEVEAIKKNGYKTYDPNYGPQWVDPSDADIAKMTEKERFDLAKYYSNDGAWRGTETRKPSNYNGNFVIEGKKMPDGQIIPTKIHDVKTGKVENLSQPLQEGNPLIQEARKTAPIDNYLHHFFQPTTETNFGGKLSTPTRGFLKQSKDIEGFVKDPIVSIAGVKSKAAVANIKEGFIKRVTDKYARSADTVTEFKNGTILAKDTGEPLIKWKGQYLPKEIGEELLRYEGKGHTAMDTVLAPLRVFNRNWKPLATAVRPRYHLRNIIGNVYNASFVGGANPLRYGTALAQQVKSHIATQMKEGTIAGQVYKALFKTAPEHKYIKMAAEDDVIGRGFFAADINDLAEVAQTSEDFTKAISKLKNPAEIYRIPVLRQWLQGSSRVGQAFEDNARLALYIDQLKRGATRVAAKNYVNKHLFDYLNGLGEADKAIKAFIPFWSWTRFNVPLQYGAIAKMPVRHLIAQEFGKPWVQQQEQNNPEYQYLSQREKDMGAVKTGTETKDGKIYDKYMRTQGVLPVQDVTKVFDPENAGLTPLFDMLKQGYNMINPPTNPQDNLDYFGRPVEQYPGEVKRYLGQPVRGTGKEILQSIPFINEINKAFGGSYTDEKRPSGSSRLETVFSPTSQSLQDREKNRQYAESDFNTLVKGDFAPGLESNFKYVVKGLLDNPSDKVLNQNKDTLIGLLKQQGYTDEGIKILIKKSIESVIKDKATINMPGKQKNILNQEEIKKILERANKLKPYFTP